MKSIHVLCDTISQFPAGCYIEYSGADSEDGSAVFKSYYENASIYYDSDKVVLKRTNDESMLECQVKNLRVRYSYPVTSEASAAGEAEVCRNIRELFTAAVNKRLMSERPV